MSYILGVDGGSSKMDFLITDENLKTVFEYRLSSLSNLKYGGPKKIIENLKQGFVEMKKAGIEPNEIKSAYLGIAECGPESGIIGRDEVFIYLSKILNKFQLEDDQFSVFYSSSTGKNGVLANAGTGSNINRFFNGEETTHKSLGYGGRDFGKMIFTMAKYGGLAKESILYKTVTDFLHQDVVEFYDNLSFEESIINKQITEISKVLFLASQNSPELKKELEVFLIFIGGRWGSKITSYCYSNFGYRPEDVFEIVLTGSLWGWDLIKRIAIDDIKKSFPHAKIIHNPQSKPVLGCVKLAKENLR